MALIDKVVAYYKFDQESGNATDATGNGYTLTNNNTVGYNSGKINNCSDTGTGNANKTFRLATDFGMDGSDAKSFVFWARVNEQPAKGTQQLFFRHLYGGSAVGNYANLGYRQTSGEVKQLAMNTSPGGMFEDYTLTNGTFYLFIINVPANNTGDITLYVNNSLVGSTANWSQNYAQTTSIGLFSENNISGDFLSGGIDEFIVFEGELDSSERTKLWNYGAGLQYPFLSNTGNFFLLI